jgi:histidyl-tRNA synthetase
MSKKPSIPKGTRDFSPAEVAKRNYIFSIIKSNFEKFGFQPIETPSFENSETLMGKYGEEGDRLIFKILDSGNYQENIKEHIDNYVDFDNQLRDSIEILMKNIDESFGIEIRNSKNIELTCYEFGKRNDVIDKFNNSFEYCIECIKNEATDLIQEVIEYFRTEIIEIVVHTLYFMNNEKDKSLVKYKIAEGYFKMFYKLAFDRTFDPLKISKKISEKALRYDLTVPFARYVVQHQNEIEFPFKRYQIQPVWRADRPQKGRFREFYQCDADVVGSTSLWQEVELVQLYDSVFTQLGLKGTTIKINNRKILSGIAEVIGASDKLIDFTVALDKLDKIGEDGVKKEMLEKGITEEAIGKIQPLFNFTGTINEKIEKLSNLLSTSVEGKKGVKELQFICSNIQELGLQTASLDLDVTLARGLNYYTGAIFEVAAPKEVAMGSIGGGGRYDDLTGIFGLKNMSGVGISFGLDRIALVIEELNLFPETVLATSKAMFINFGDKEALYSMKAITKLRAENIKVELYPDNAKIGKQFQHADKRGIPFAVLVGEEEMNNQEFTLKNLGTGEQQKVDYDKLVVLLK